MALGRAITPLLLAGALVACSGSQREADQKRGSAAPVTARSLDAVLAAHTDSLMRLPGVVGTAIGMCDGERCIKVLVADSALATQKHIPQRLEGYRVVVEVTGTIRPL